MKIKNMLLASSILLLSPANLVYAATNNTNANNNQAQININGQKITITTDNNGFTDNTGTINNDQLQSIQSQINVNQKDPNKNNGQANNGAFLNQPNNNLQGQSTDSNANSTTTSSSADSQPNYASSNYYNNFGYSHFTRYNLEHMQDGLNRGNKNPIGNFRGMKISDVTSAKVKSVQQNVWDSWPLQDANGNEVTYNGYHIVFALTGNPDNDYKLASGQEIQNAHIFVFYQKVGTENQGIKSWKNAGQLFKTSAEGSNGKDIVLNKERAQWSGQTIKMSDGSIRLFYTSFNGDGTDDWQTLSTAKIQLKATKSGIQIVHSKTSDHKSILQPDGSIYQKLSQAKTDNYDENAFRDPHYFEYQGKKYLIFESNSGTDDGYQGDDALYNKAYLGGNAAFQQQQQNLIIPTNNNPWHLPAVDYNGTVGMVQLNNDFTVKKVMKPILGMNTITDEFERPNLFEHNGKWYLFGIARGYKLATPSVKSTDAFMLGFVSNSPFGPFKPLNKNGLVVRNTRAWSSRYYSYSFYVLNNQNKNNNLVVTDYMTNAKLPIGHQTFGASFMLNLNGNKAKVQQNQVLPQGAVTSNNTKFVK